MRTSGQEKQLWRVEVTVSPAIEWKNLGLGSIEVDTDTTIIFEKQVEGGSLFYVTLPSNPEEIAPNWKAVSIVKSVIALLELEDKKNYEIQPGTAQPLQATYTKEGRVLVAVYSQSGIKVVPRIEDLDISFMKTVINLLKTLDEDKRNRILRILNFLYDGLNAPSDVQSFLMVYGGLNFLTSSVGKQDNTVLSDSVTLFEFLDANVINTTTAKSWMVKLHTFHHRHYDVLKENQVKREEVDTIKTFFKDFLQSYIEYVSKPSRLKP